jgi:hypothetical protein
MKTRLEKLQERIETLEKILSSYPVGYENFKNEERVLIQILIETKKEYKLQMYQD